jgi:Protein of unknown function (DUF2490)
VNNLRWLSISLLFTVLNANAQSKIVEEGNQQWAQYYGQVKLTEKWNLLADGGYRLGDNFTKKVQYIVRAGIEYTINPSLRLAAGFANLGFYSGQKINKTEFRPYEEMSIKNTFPKFDFNHRFRIEERFFNPVLDGKIERPGTFNFRFRYSFMVGIPMVTLSKKNRDKKILLNIGDEIFFNAGKHIVYNVFDQNRLIISPTVQFSKNFAVSFTCNNQFAATTTAKTYDHTNVAWLQVKQKFDFTRKKK